jgi:hypothetical protein
MLGPLSFSQWAHSVRMRTETGWFRRCPCTKGIAKVSTAQGDQASSPLLKVAWCGVSSTVTG